MSDKNGFCNSLAKVFKEMCRRVGAKYKDIDFHSSGWYKEYTWSIEERESFKKWLIDFLYNNAKARKELMSTPQKNKQLCEKAAVWFMFDYSWMLDKLTISDVENQIAEVAKLGENS